MSSKKQTSQSVMAEIERTRKVNARRNEKIAELRAEVVADNAKIKELEKLYKKLNQAELQYQISLILFKEQEYDEAKVLKLLELSRQLGDGIKDIDPNALAGMIGGKSGGSAKKSKTAPQEAEPPVEIPEEPSPEPLTVEPTEPQEE
jgi:TolA-binding protein